MIFAPASGGCTVRLAGESFSSDKGGRVDCFDADDAADMLSWDHHGGFSLDASVCVADWDRAALERICRYCARHPLSKGRLQRAGPQRVIYQLPKPDIHGNTELTLNPLELLDRLAGLILPPRRHRHSYWGALAALELRSGIPKGATPKSLGPDMIRAMTTQLWLDFLGIRLDSKKAEGKAFTINLATPDNGEKFVVELSHATLNLNVIEGFQEDDADLTITIKRSDLEQTMMGVVSFDKQIASGKAKLEGNRDVYEQLKKMLVHFEIGCEMMPGTGDADLSAERKPFEQEPLGRSDGG